MSRTGRIAVLVGALVLAGVAFVLLRPDEESRPAGETAQPTATPAEPPEEGRQRTPQGRTERIEVRNGEPRGGVAKIKVSQGELVRLRVTSDEPEEVHLHGYDLADQVGPGDVAQLGFRAKNEGVFEIELEGSGVQIGELRVEP